VATPEDSDTEYDRYLEERRDANRHCYDAQEQIDKVLLTLSSSGLAISLTLFHQVSPTPEDLAVYYLKASWLFFGVAVMAVVVSLLASKYAFSARMDVLDADYHYGGKDVSAEAKWARVTAATNWIAFVAFAFGVLAFALFVSYCL